MAIDSPEAPKGLVPETGELAESVIAASDVEPVLEGVKSPEEKREDVITALNTAVSLMEVAKETGELNNDEAVDLQELLIAKERTLDKGRETYSPGRITSNVSGISYGFRDRIHVDRLILFMGKKIDAEIASDSDSEKAKEYAQIVQTLTENSRSYIRKGRRMSGDRLTARVDLEHTNITSGPRNTHDDLNNYFLAQHLINTRLELFIPKVAKIEVEATTPVAADAKPAAVVAEAPPVSEPLPDLDEDHEPVVVQENEDGIPPPPTIREMRAEYAATIGNRQEAIRKAVAYVVSQEIVKREDLGIERKNPLVRGLRLFHKRVLTRKGWEATKFGLTREHYRHTRTQALMEQLSEINFGANNNLTIDALLKTVADKGQVKIDTMKLREAAGISAAYREELPFEVTGELRDYVIGQIIRPTMNSLRSGRDVKEIQAEIQKKMYDYVSTHQDNEGVRAYFGENAHRYGEVSQFYATDILETAQMMNEDARSHELATGQLDEIIKVRVMRAKWAKSTEIPYTVIDRLVAAGQAHRGLGWLTPATASVLTFGGARLGTSVLRKAAIVGAGALTVASSPVSFPLLAGITVGATFAYAREKQRFKSDLRDSSRDLEAGIVSTDKMHVRRTAEAITSPMMVRKDQLFDGDRTGDQGELIGNSPRKRIQDILTADLSLEQNKQNLINRYAEICSRLDAPNEQVRRFLSPVLAEVGRIKYNETEESIEETGLKLTQKLIELRQKALDAGISQDVLDLRVEQWGDALITNRKEAERRYQIKSLRRGLGYAGVASVTGVFSSLIFQEGMALGARAPGIEDTGIGKFGKSPTIIERGFQKAGIDVGPSSGGSDEVVSRKPNVMNATMGEWRQESLALNANDGKFDLDDIVESYNKGESFSIKDLNFVPNQDLNPDGTRSYSIADRGTGSVLYPENLVTINDHGTIQIKSPIDSATGLPPQVKGLLEKDSFLVSEETLGTTEPYTVLTPDTKLYESGMGFDGPKTMIPEGTVWIDGKDGAHTLIVADRPDIVLIPDAKLVEVNGQMTLEWDKNYKYPGYDSRMVGGRNEGLLSNIQIEPGQSEVKVNILGEDGVWKENATPVRHLWYTYNTEVSDQSELMLYTHKQGDVLVLDMSKMGEVYQDGLPTVNTQDVIREGRAVFAFSVPNDIDNPILVSDRADGVADGLLRLDPNAPESMRIDPDNPNSMSLAEFSKMIVNQEELAKYPDGDIATEVYHREAVFNLGKDGMRGCIEGGFMGDSVDGTKRYMDIGLIRGSSAIPETAGGPGTPPEIKIGPLVENIPHEQITTTIIPPDFPENPPPPLPLPPLPPPIPPVPGREAPPLIPIDIVMRSTLETAKPTEPTPEGSGSYDGERFPEGARLRDILRRSPRGIRNTMPESYDVGEPEMDRTEAELALAEVKSGFSSAEHIYVVVSSGPMGDAIVGTAYFQGLKEALEKQGRNVPMTLVVNKVYEDLFTGLSAPNINIESVPGGKGISYVRGLISSSKINNSLVLDFENYGGRNPTVYVNEDDGIKSTEISNLLKPGIELYHNGSDSDRRFTHFVEELFSLDPDLLDPKSVKPTVILPTNKDDIYNDVVREFSIDTSKPQIAVVVESSVAGKRYSVRQWADTIKQLSAYNNYQFNIIYRPGSNGYTKEEIESALDEYGVKDISKVVNGDLLKMAVLLERQKLILSNDTGLAHVAGALPAGPQIVTLFAPRRFSPNFWVSSAKQLGIELSSGEVAALPEDDPRLYSNATKDSEVESVKTINKIRPETIVHRAVEALLKS